MARTSTPGAQLRQSEMRAVSPPADAWWYACRSTRGAATRKCCGGTSEEKRKREDEQYMLSRGRDVREEMLCWGCGDRWYVRVCARAPFLFCFFFLCGWRCTARGCAKALSADATSTARGPGVKTRDTDGDGVQRRRQAEFERGARHEKGEYRPCGRRTWGRQARVYFRHPAALSREREREKRTEAILQ